ncbi:MAG: hypothetical protein GYB65_19770 [Chloroflexi bacterium]|nr:hypothetical protein [Chloroflexota bacterium]
MLTGSIRLQLLIGETLPRPAPYEVLQALVSAQVNMTEEGRDGFQLILRLGRDTPSDSSLLRDGLFDPPSRVTIGVMLGVVPTVLINGVITRHEVMASNTPGEAQLVVTGDDSSLDLDLEERTRTFPNMSDSAIARRIIGEYQLQPDVTDTQDTPSETNRMPSQQRTDLAYLRELATRNGFVFYIEPGPVPGISVAHWGPENRDGQPQLALSVGRGPNSNVEHLQFGFNSLTGTNPTVTIRDPLTQTPIQVPAPDLLNPSLTQQQAQPRRTTIARDVGGFDTNQALLRALAESQGNADSSTGNGWLNTARYGRILQARRLVDVSGAGNTYDGTYFVKAVQHIIRVGEYTQRFTLSRGGRGASSPRVATA